MAELIDLIPENLRIVNHQRHAEINVKIYSPMFEYYKRIQLRKAGFLVSRAKRRAIEERALDTLMEGLVNRKEDSKKLKEHKLFTISPSGRLEGLTYEFLTDDKNWINNALSMALVRRVSECIGGENPWPEIAYFYAKYSSKLSDWTAKRIRLIGGPKGFYQNIAEETKRWNKAKSFEIQHLTDREFTIRCIYNPEISADSNNQYAIKEVCKFNMGLFSSAITLFNGPLSFAERWRIPPADIAETACVLEGAPYCQFEGTYESRIKDPLVMTARTFFLMKDSYALLKMVKERDDSIEKLTTAKETLEGRAKQLAGDLIQAEQDKHLLEMDLSLARTLEEVMHIESSLLINPMSTLSNVAREAGDAWNLYHRSLSQGKNPSEAFTDLEYSMQRLQNTYPLARKVVDSQRKNAKAYHEILISSAGTRDINEDLVHLQALINSGIAFTRANVTLELSDKVPKLDLKGRLQAAFLEIAINAVRHGKATEILAKTDYIPAGKDARFSQDAIGVHIYDNGTGIREPDRIFAPGYSTSGSTGQGLANVHTRVKYNSGIVQLEASDIPEFNTHFAIYIPIPNQ